MREKFICLLILAGFIIFPAGEVYPYAGSHKGILTCSDCHTAYPTSISDPQGNANLCLSCHTGGAMASNLALYSVDQATITESGVYNKSHRWDALVYQANISTNPAEVLTRTVTYYSGGESHEANLTDYIFKNKYSKAFKDTDKAWRISCSSCHNSKTASFIRNEQERDEKLCRDCHTYDHQLSTTSAREFTGKKQNHPTKTVGGSYVGCSSCHVIHAK